MALFKKTKMQDVLEQKETKLSILNQQSDDAVQLVRSTLNGLDAIDAEIEQTISEIDAIQARMRNARAGLEARREKNQRIKQNFKSLLCEE
jgi:chlorite dismutase